MLKWKEIIQKAELNALVTAKINATEEMYLGITEYDNRPNHVLLWKQEKASAYISVYELNWNRTASLLRNHF